MAQQGTADVCKQCEIPVREPCQNLRSEKGQRSYGWRRVGLFCGGRVIRRAKKEGRKSYVGFSICSTLSRPSRRQVHEPVDQCFSCTRHLTCSTVGPSARECEYRNAGRQCTGCYCWGRCKNKGRLMPPPTTARGLLGNLPRGADLHTTEQSDSPPPVRLSTSLSLRAILAARARGGGARGKPGGRRFPRDGGGEGNGAGGRTRGSRGATSSETGVAARKTAAKKMTAAWASGRSHEPKSQLSSDGAGGEYRVEGTDQ